MTCSTVSLLLLAVVAGPLPMDDPTWESVRMPDARVLLVAAFPYGRIVVKQGRTLVYEVQAEPRRSGEGSGRGGRVSGRESSAKPAAGTLTPAPLKPQPVRDKLSPPPYLTITTGRDSLMIEAGLGNYEISIELRMPRQAR
jgi:hypothetical protein